MAKTREELKNVKIEVDGLRKSIVDENIGEMKIKFTELEDRVEDVAKESTELKKMIEENGNND